MSVDFSRCIITGLDTEITISNILSENLSPYCASKGGIIAMTRALALEFAPKKINVNCICPGAIKTGMTKMIEENETMLKQTLMAIPVGQMGDPMDIVNATLYLASDESDYVTGCRCGWRVECALSPLKLLGKQSKIDDKLSSNIEAKRKSGIMKFCF